MAFEPFNSAGGFTVGIPPVEVIDGNGALVSNVLTSGNVVANVIRGTTFLYANGQPLTAAAAGSNTYVQFNNNGVFGASPDFRFNSASSLLTVSNLSVTGLTNLGQVGNITIDGGVAGYVLSTDGLGNLSWVTQSGGGGNGNPGGGNRAVQYNDDEEFGGNSFFTFNETTGTLSVNNIISTNLTGTLLTQNQPNITAVGNLANLTFANGGNINNANWVKADYFMGNAYNLFYINGSNVEGPVTEAGFAGLAAAAAVVTNNNQPNITSTGTLSKLTVAGNVNLGNLANIKIYGGTPGYVISTDGTGNLSWSVGGGGNGGGVPGGINTQVQFNDQGAFAGNVNFTFDKTTGALAATFLVGDGSNLSNINASNVIGTVSNATYAVSAGNANSAVFSTTAGSAGTVTTGNQPNITATGTLANLTVAGTSNLGAVANLTILGGSANYILATDGAGNLSWKASGAGGNPGGGNTTVQFNDENSFGGDNAFTFNKTTGVMTVPYISSNFTGNGANLTSLNGANVTGTVANATYAVNSGTAIVASLATNVTGASQGNITSLGTLTGLTVNGTSTLGNIGNVKITGGSANFYLQTDGTGNLSWVPGGGGGGNPGGSNTQIQYNNAGVFSGSPNLVWDQANLTMQVGGNLVANTMQLGSGAFKWSTSFVYFASTASSSSGQIIYSIPVTNVSGVEFEIMATEPLGPSRQFCKISSIYYNGSVQYNEYSTLIVNGGVGNYEVDYYPGDMVTPPSIQLKVSPGSANPITYKMLIQVFAE